METARNQLAVREDGGHSLAALPPAELSFLLTKTFEPDQSADATVPSALAPTGR